MNEILDHPIQQGESRLTNRGCDIVFDHVALPMPTANRS